MGADPRLISVASSLPPWEQVAGDNAQDMIGCIDPRFHPSCDVTPGPDFPFMDMWRVAESLEFVADPGRPVAVAARVADENIGHAAKPRARHCPTVARSILVVVCALCKPMRQGYRSPAQPRSAIA